MPRFIASALLAALVLSGCGASGSPTAAKAKATTKTTAAAKASPTAVAEKGVLAMFKRAYKDLDADKSGGVSKEELADADLAETLPGLPAFDKLDRDANGQISAAEFTHKDVLAGRAKDFKAAAAAAFSSLDDNGDKALVKAELEEAEMPFDAADTNKNKKVDLVEFEAAYATALAK